MVIDNRENWNTRLMQWPTVTILLKGHCTIMSMTSYSFVGFRIESFLGHSGSGGVM